MIKDPEKGVSLIITFFILVVILAVVFSVSVILYSEIKIIRNIGDSVVAFYAGDAGVEKTLYYDRKKVPEGAVGSKRGLCDLCKRCAQGGNGEQYCQNCTRPNTPDCNPLDCKNCTVSFDTTIFDGLTSKKYHVEAVVTEQTPSKNQVLKSSKLVINSFGSYRSAASASEIKRGIELVAQKDETEEIPPEITNAKVFYRWGQTGSSFRITAQINSHGHGLKTVQAGIQEASGSEPVTVDMALTGTEYVAVWQPPAQEGSYIVTITACDPKGICSEAVAQGQ